MCIYVCMIVGNTGESGCLFKHLRMRILMRLYIIYVYVLARRYLGRFAVV